MRILALTGARKNEIVKLTWSEVDLDHECLRLKDSKTGQKVVPLGRSVIELFLKQPRSQNVPSVFPSERADKVIYYQGIEKSAPLSVMPIYQKILSAMPQMKFPIKYQRLLSTNKETIRLLFTKR